MATHKNYSEGISVIRRLIRVVGFALGAAWAGARGLAGGVGVCLAALGMLAVIIAPPENKVKAAILITPGVLLIALAFPKAWERVFWRPFEWLANAIASPLILWDRDSRATTPRALRLVSTLAMLAALTLVADFVFSGRALLYVYLIKEDLLAVSPAIVLRIIYVVTTVLCIPPLCRLDFGGWIASFVVSISWALLWLGCSASSHLLDMLRVFPEHAMAVRRAYAITTAVIAVGTAITLLRVRRFIVERATRPASLVAARERVFLWIQEWRLGLSGILLICLAGSIGAIYGAHRLSIENAIRSPSGFPLRVLARFAPDVLLEDQLSPCPLGRKDSKWLTRACHANAPCWKLDLICDALARMGQNMPQVNGLKADRFWAIDALCLAIILQKKDIADYFFSRETDLPSAPWISNDLYLAGMFVEGEHADHETYHRLEKRGHSPNIAVCRGMTLLHFAATEGRLCCIRYFLAKGLKPDSVDLAGRDPLYAAVAGRRIEVIRYLVEHVGMDPKKVYPGQENLLHVLASRGDSTTRRYPATLDYLVNAGVDIKARDASGMTPLDVVEDPDVMQAFRLKGAKTGSALSPDDEEDVLSTLLEEIKESESSQTGQNANE